METALPVQGNLEILFEQVSSLISVLIFREIDEMKPSECHQEA